MGGGSMPRRGNRMGRGRGMGGGFDDFGGFGGGFM